ncbi:MAG: PilZ domain-containing protein [Deltaproteobacteria bacterium]|nr:PilZ domain-containing protein [Deltaproteobacteria bacterium]MDZ4224971.1 PilZ domain-containing protein [bacterium]
MPDSKNRRKFARLDIALSVTYAVESGAGEASEYAEAISSDISAGGLRLMTPAPLENGTRLDLEIFIGEGEDPPIQAKGEVVWQNKIADTSFETGVVINQMDNNAKKRFMAFVFDQMSKCIGIAG